MGEGWLVLNTDDVGTVRAVHELLEETAPSDRPLVFFVGAGASAWAGLPLWCDLAQKAHQTFVRSEKGYDASQGLALINEGDLPQFFSVLKRTAHKRYNRLLKAELATRTPRPVYRRFIQAMTSVSPVRAVTTNADEMLEHSVPDAQVVQHEDIEQVSHLQASGKSYILKLHGSISRVESVVFTTEEYAVLWGTPVVTSVLAGVFSGSTVVFVGYGIQDLPLLKLVERLENTAELLGDGPHYAILPSAGWHLPGSIRVIEYEPVPHKDHRASITVVEELSAVRSSEPLAAALGSPPSLQSAHLLFDVFPPGTWSTSEVAQGTSLDSGSPMSVVTGMGFKDAELATKKSTALNDLLVGLVCFDVVYAPFGALTRLFKMVGEGTFLQLLHEDSLRFLRWERELALVFRSTEPTRSGTLNLIQTREQKDAPDLGTLDYLRRWITPVAGREREAERNIELMARQIRTISTDDEQKLVGRTRSLLLSRRIRRMLGISAGTPLNQVPVWHRFAVLRLGHVVKIGTVCNLLEVASAKLDYGASGLAGPAFATSFGQEWCDSVASYVLCGRFSEDLAAMAESDPAVINAILTFRESAAGTALRADLMAQIASSEAGEVYASVNAGLRHLVPTGVLEQARQEFVGLYMPPKELQQARPAFWNDARSADAALRLWRVRSLRDLEQACNDAGVSAYDPCPCGSGERLRFCCEEALKVETDDNVGCSGWSHR